MTSGAWIDVATRRVLLLSICLMPAGRGVRLRRGTGSRRTVLLDRVTLNWVPLGRTGSSRRMVRSLSRNGDHHRDAYRSVGLST